MSSKRKRAHSSTDDEISIGGSPRKLPLLAKELNYLLIKSSEDSQPIPNLKFHKFNCIGRLSIKANGTEGGSTIPKLVPDRFISKLVDTPLLDAGFDTAFKNTEAKVVENLDERAILYKWLIETSFFKGVQEKVYQKPDFICFGSRIALQLITFFQPRASIASWTMFAAKYMDSIFIWRNSKSSIKESMRQFAEKEYASKKYKELVTLVERLTPSSQSINEYEKNLVLQEVTFGPHQLLLANEVNAEETQETHPKEEDKEPNWALVTTILKHPAPKTQNSRRVVKGQYAKLWASGVISRVTKYVVGIKDRDPNWSIEKSTVMETDDILEEAGIDMSEIEKAYHFENRLLTWIKSKFTENDPNLVKKFTWKFRGPKRDRLECFKVDKNFHPLIVDKPTGKVSNL